MNEKILTCVECPRGCDITVTMVDGRVTDVRGNACPRGKLYAESEVVCPRRVLTTTVRTKEGRLLPVKTDKPIPREKLLEVMDIVNTLHPEGPLHIGDVVFPHICEDANLVVSGV